MSLFPPRPLSTYNCLLIAPVSSTCLRYNLGQGSHVDYKYREEYIDLSPSSKDQNCDRPADYFEPQDLNDSNYLRKKVNCDALKVERHVVVAKDELPSGGTPPRGVCPWGSHETIAPERLTYAYRRTPRSKALGADVLNFIATQARVASLSSNMRRVLGTSLNTPLDWPLSCLYPSLPRIVA
ncbi:hypothetical protein DFS33DRAFT_643024 [Desarmillaria ectypa]|nr:hypothetical protein DFS33DRAFT_643024 [Desarmillaria ectypa]